MLQLLEMIPSLCIHVCVCVPVDGLISATICNILFLLKIKRTGEMARKLRFFKDQMSKAGLSASAKSDTQDDIKFDDLEVNVGYRVSSVIQFLVIKPCECI